MNASVPSSAIYVTDSAKDIKNKVWLQMSRLFCSFSKSLKFDGLVAGLPTVCLDVLTLTLV